MKLENKHVFRMFFIATIIILLLPYSFRTVKDNTTLPGEESYYPAIIAKQTMEQGIPRQDNSAFNSRDYTLNPYHLMLTLFSYIFGIVNASRMLPFILGMLSVLVFYLILKKLRVEKMSTFSILGVFVLSPLFTYAFSLSTEWGLVIFLNLLGLYLFMQRNKWQIALSVIPLGITALFGITYTVLSAAMIFFYAFYHKKKQSASYAILALLALILFAHNIPTFIKQESVSFIQQNLATEFVSDLGGIYGFSVFTLVLALLGLIMVWRFKKKYYSLYAFSLILIAYSFYSKEAVIYSSFIIVFLAGMAFATLSKMKWRLDLVRNFCMIVLFCGLLFSTISHAVLISDLQPDDDLKDALLWLNHRSDPDDRIFSHYSKGFWIEYWAERPVLLDGLLANTPDASLLYEDSDEIFHSNDIRIVQKLLSKYDIKYVLMTQDMTKGLVWEKQGQGLDFLITNSETFKKRYANPSSVIYEYIYKEK